jgi:5-methylcytosine-specific restriction protein A
MAKLTMLRPMVSTADTRIAKPPPFIPPPKASNPFYSSAAWISLRDRVRREAGGRCQWQGCKGHGRWVDHIVEIKDGGAKLDRANTWLLCSSHHQLKTAEVKRQREASRAVNMGSTSTDLASAYAKHERFKAT